MRGISNIYNKLKGKNQHICKECDGKDHGCKQRDIDIMECEYLNYEREGKYGNSNIYTTKLNTTNNTIPPIKHILYTLTDTLTLIPYLTLESSLLGFTTKQKEIQSLRIYDKFLSLEITLTNYMTPIKNLKYKNHHLRSD